MECMENGKWTSENENFIAKHRAQHRDRECINIFTHPAANIRREDDAQTYHKVVKYRMSLNARNRFSCFFGTSIYTIHTTHMQKINMKKVFRDPPPTPSPYHSTVLCKNVQNVNNKYVYC